MAKYRVLVKSYINSTIVEAGEVVEYDGKPGSNLELVEGDKPDAKPAKGKTKGAAPAALEAGNDAGADLV
jgi:hypothetical protein